MPWLEVLNKHRAVALEALAAAAPREPVRAYFHELLMTQTAGV